MHAPKTMGRLARELTPGFGHVTLHAKTYPQQGQGFDRALPRMLSPIAWSFFFTGPASRLEGLLDRSDIYEPISIFKPAF